MKNLKNLVGLLLFSLMLVGCSRPTAVFGDEDSPEITVLSPNEGYTFYTDGGVDSPDYVVMDAKATDESSIKIATVTIYDSSDEVVYNFQSLANSVNGNSVTQVHTSFKAIHEGNYTVKFEFEDALGNVSIVIRNITCIYSPLDGDTDTGRIN